MFRQLQVQLLLQEWLIPLRLGIAAQDQGSVIGGGQLDIDHLQGRAFLQGGARGQPGAPCPQAMLEGELQAVGAEGDKERRLDAIPAWVENGTSCQIGLEFLERLLDVRELDVILPKLGRIGVAEVGAEQVAPFTAPSLT